jgi:pimeloyl-ACP methyl ester carboxylesterase
MTHDESPLLKANIPMLGLFGANDRHVYGPKLAELVRERFKDSEIYTFDGCGHSPFFEKPQDTNEAILQFVARVKSNVSFLAFQNSSTDFSSKEKM